MSKGGETIGAFVVDRAKTFGLQDHRTALLTNGFEDAKAYLHNQTTIGTMSAFCLFLKKVLVLFLLATLFVVSFVDTRLKYEELKYHPSVIAFESKLNANPIVLELRDQYAKLNENDDYQNFVVQAASSYKVVAPYIESTSQQWKTVRQSLRTNIRDPVEANVLNPIKEKTDQWYDLHAAPHVERFSESLRSVYDQHLSNHVKEIKAVSNDIYVRVSPHIQQYSIIVISNVSKYTAFIYKHASFFFGTYVAPIVRKVYNFISQKIFELYIHLRLTYYIKLLPTVKKTIYRLTYEVAPSYYNQSKLFITDVIVPKVILNYKKAIVSSKAAARYFYLAYVLPYFSTIIDAVGIPITFYKNIIHPKLQKLYIGAVAPAVKHISTSAKKTSQRYLAPWFSYVSYVLVYQYRTHLRPFLLNEKGENVVAEFFSSRNFLYVAIMTTYNNLQGKYYEFLTSDPLDAEIERLSALLTQYATSTFLTDIGATTDIASATFAASTATSTAEISANSTEGPEVQVSRFLKAESNLTPVQKQVGRWQGIVSGTCKSVLEDLDKEFLDFEEQYVGNSFKPVLEQHIRKYNDFINDGYYQIQKLIRNIDSADIFMNSQNFILNDHELKEPKSSKVNEELKYFKNEYPGDATDPSGLSHANYLQLIDEVLYLNDLAYNKSLIERSLEDPDFKDRDFFMKYVIVGKDIDVSFGDVNKPDEDVPVNQFALLTAGDYRVTSDLLKRVTINNVNRNIITKVSRKAVRNKFTEVREGLQYKAEIMKNVIESGFYDIFEEFNSLKFKNMEIFEEFSDIILDEWDKKFVEFLEKDPVCESDEDDESFLFDIDSLNEKDINGDNYSSNNVIRNNSEKEKEDGDQSNKNQLVEFYKSKKELYNSELAKKREQHVKVNHKKNWRNFKEFYKIKETLLKTRSQLNDAQPNLDPAHEIATSIDRTISVLMNEAKAYLDILRAQANLAFQFREEHEKNERIRRFNKFNPPPVEQTIEDPLVDQDAPAESANVTISQSDEENAAEIWPETESVQEPDPKTKAPKKAVEKVNADDAGQRPLKINENTADSVQGDVSTIPKKSEFTESQLDLSDSVETVPAKAEDIETETEDAATTIDTEPLETSADETAEEPTSAQTDKATEVSVSEPAKVMKSSSSSSSSSSSDVTSKSVIEHTASTKKANKDKSAAFSRISNPSKAPKPVKAASAAAGKIEADVIAPVAPSEPILSSSPSLTATSGPAKVPEPVPECSAGQTSRDEL